MNFESMYFLAEFCFSQGLIGLDEYRERIEVANWLSAEDDTPDPRKPKTKRTSPDIEDSNEVTSDNSDQEHNIVLGVPRQTGPAVLELVRLNVWYFTLGDADCYPSVPHGHYENENNPWPKLNPYTGRVFECVHREKGSMRLSKSEMRALWTDETFKGHCRKQILWYIETHTNYGFPVKYPMRFPRW